MVEFNYNKLKGIVREKFGTQAEYAKMLGISQVSLSHRLNNRIPFTQREIMATKQFLNLSQKEVEDIFFTIR